MPSNNWPTVLKAHIALNVSDVDRSVEFYSRMLGTEPMKLRPGYAKFDVQNPPLNLTLNAALHSRGGALSQLSHLGLQVATTDDVLALRLRWIAAGLTVRDEMKTECCYALQDKSWVHDPDGNEWEVFTVIADVEQTGNACCQPLVQLLK
jgi:catechol 2,3-dioxygenase-like lactoylglutathione lyase family enzyme